MIYATGDTHGGFQRFNEEYFPQQAQMTRDDYMIICGDFGGVWSGDAQEQCKLDWLENRPFTTLFVDGNHENFDRLAALPVEMWHGGEVHKVRPHILHLMRGQVFEVDGYTFFTMGGASSHDIDDGVLDPAAPDFEETYWLKRRLRQRFRVKGISWWEHELPSQEEYGKACRNLERVSYKVDYIISHCCPSSLLPQLSPDYAPDQFTDFLDEVKTRTDYHYWLFGHYHDNKALDERHILLWEQMVEIT